jgi:hypothetical protein
VFFRGRTPPFDDQQTRLELLRRFNEVPGVSFGPEVIRQGGTQRAFIQLRVLADPAALEELKRVLEWMETQTGYTPSASPTAGGVATTPEGGSDGTAISP